MMVYGRYEHLNWLLILKKYCLSITTSVLKMFFFLYIIFNGYYILIYSPIHTVNLWCHIEANIISN